MMPDASSSQITINFYAWNVDLDLKLSLSTKHAVTQPKKDKRPHATFGQITFFLIIKQQLS